MYVFCITLAGHSFFFPIYYFSLSNTKKVLLYHTPPLNRVVYVTIIYEQTLMFGTVTTNIIFFFFSDMQRKEGNVLFIYLINTFYLRLYGVRHMVKDHSDSEKGNPLPPHRLLFTINSKGSFICTIPQTG